MWSTDCAEYCSTEPIQSSQENCALLPLQSVMPGRVCTVGDRDRNRQVCHKGLAALGQELVPYREK
jgi:hypothetical protein